MKYKNDFSDALRQIQRLSADYRGKIIEATVVIENLIQWANAKYFTANDRKYRELLETVFFEYGFEKNIQTFRYIIENSFPDLLTRYPELFKDIKKIQELRNTLAHSRTDTRKETVIGFDGENIHFKSIKRGKEQIKVINKKSVQLHMNTINKMFDTLENINKIIQDRRMQEEK